jgi:hypothetical protein
MLIVTALVDEIKVNAERADFGRSLYQILLLLICDAFNVQLIKGWNIVIANKVLSTS